MLVQYYVRLNPRLEELSALNHNIAYSVSYVSYL